ncbi:hypothetical protein J3Q64DRAFT_1721744 [Phycomyces blakesleeanus]|uniref:Transmembrane protein n=2 Tax=Phycomyces blakesleeanus TaxID=4837 RepID=A0A167NWU6_PHYB8|nr:hypothetical protein PHYBLDRAFT_63013 [Phycomyces blakesleeanus NRRL 1555(-)]OAD76786.1 hypothetical protein PHYBLDRAFT_63013 [Phycomyces blakesleeanus NRRL 1555(-)]|eukprot:XP_018294826.1 hypothetical protein PHYBLDRAFT_63013 [Phycomyces blakesleeanus NRRL 1555(-)]
MVSLATKSTTFSINQVWIILDYLWPVLEDPVFITVFSVLFILPATLFVLHVLFVLFTTSWAAILMWILTVSVSITTGLAVLVPFFLFAVFTATVLTGLCTILKHFSSADCTSLKDRLLTMSNKPS